MITKQSPPPMYIEPLLAAAIGGVFQYVGEQDPRYKTMTQVAKYGAAVGVANLISIQGTSYLMPDIFTNPKMRHVQHAALNAGVTAGINVFLQQAISSPKDLRVIFNAQAGALAGGGASLASEYLF